MNRNYKWCAVSQCTNTTKKTPDKLFIRVPQEKTMRAKWFTCAGRDPKAISPISQIYFCEDHFDLPNDMENYMQYHVMGSVTRVRVRHGCIPTKFECHTRSKKRTSKNRKRPNILKKLRKELIEEIKKDVEGKTTKHLQLEKPESSENIVHTDEIIVKIEHLCDTNTVFDERPCAENVNIIGDEEMCLADEKQYVADEKQYAEEMNFISEAQLVPDFCDPEETQIKQEYSCNICSEPISGLRHACAQCDGCDLCGACAARGEHSYHFLLRIPSHSTHKEAQTVLNALRQLLESLGLQEDPSVAVIKEEVTTEDLLCDDGAPQGLHRVCGEVVESGRNSAHTKPSVPAKLGEIYEVKSIDNEANLAVFTHTNSTSNIHADTMPTARGKRNPYYESHTIPQKFKKHYNQNFVVHKNTNEMIVLENSNITKILNKDYNIALKKGNIKTVLPRIAPKGPIRLDLNSNGVTTINNASIANNVETDGIKNNLIAPNNKKYCVYLNNNTKNVILVECPTESAMSIEQVLEMYSLAMNVANEMQFSTSEVQAQPLEVIDCSKEVRVNIPRLTEDEIRDAAGPRRGKT